MLQAWQNFLQQSNGIFHENTVLHFSATLAEESQAVMQNAAICDLNHYTLLEISGDDAKKFLQGQLTCDLNAIHQSSLLGAYCNRKGRVLAIFRITQHQEQYLLCLPSELADYIIQELKKQEEIDKLSQ